MITQDRIRELFDYHKDGFLIRKIRTSSDTKIGERAGSLSKSDGYRYIYIDNNNYKEHRIIWMWHYGFIPKEITIDHKNRDRDDNKISNLRICTMSQNSCNTPKRIDNTSGYIGVSLFPYDNRAKKWRAYISVDRIRKTLGYFSTPEEAAICYNSAAIKYHGEFAKQNKVA